MADREQGWKATAWRDNNGDLWCLDNDAILSDDVVCLCERVHRTPEDLVAKHGGTLTPAAVDNVEALLVDHTRLVQYVEEHRQRILNGHQTPGEPDTISQVRINVDTADPDALRAEIRRLDHRLRWMYDHLDEDGTASLLAAYELASQRDAAREEIGLLHQAIDAQRELRRSAEQTTLRLVETTRRVRAIHTPTAGEGDTRWCSVCSQDEERPAPIGWWVPWPCPTVAALDDIPDPTDGP